MSDIEIIEPQICFVQDGFMTCNWKRHNGKPLYTKSGKWWRWKAKFKRSKKQKEANPNKEITS